jgi:hypothetical protein
MVGPVLIAVWKKICSRWSKSSAISNSEWVVTSNFGLHGTGVKENLPRRARRTRRMEAGVKTGLLINFNVVKPKSGIKRFVL